MRGRRRLGRAGRGRSPRGADQPGTPPPGTMQLMATVLATATATAMALVLAPPPRGRASPPGRAPAPGWPSPRSSTRSPTSSPGVRCSAPPRPAVPDGAGSTWRARSPCTTAGCASIRWPRRAGGDRASPTAPSTRRPGLAVAARVLHSHGNAHTDHQGIRRSWLMRRLVRQPFSGQLLPVPLEDSLTVGFHAEAAPADPTASGAAFVVHAAGPVNAELRARVGGGAAQLHRGTQDVPFTYVVVLRPEGAIYYASSLSGAAGAVDHPWMRPLAIDPTGGGPLVHATIHQAVHAESGYSMSTGVEEVRVGDVPALAGWFTSALAADTLRGSPGPPGPQGSCGPLAGSSPERGGPWRVLHGAPQRTPPAWRPTSRGCRDRSRASRPAWCTWWWRRHRSSAAPTGRDCCGGGTRTAATGRAQAARAGRPTPHPAVGPAGGSWSATTGPSWRWPARAAGRRLPRGRRRCPRPTGPHCRCSTTARP